MGRRTQLFGTLFTAAIGAFLATLLLAHFLGLSFLLSILVYSFTGSVIALLLAWRRFTAAEDEEDTASWEGAGRAGYIPMGAGRRSQ